MHASKLDLTLTFFYCFCIFFFVLPFKYKFILRQAEPFLVKTGISLVTPQTLQNTQHQTEGHKQPRKLLYLGRDPHDPNTCLAEPQNKAHYNSLWPGLHYNSKNHTPRWRCKILRHATDKETCGLHIVPLHLHRPVPDHKPGRQRNPVLYKPDCCSPGRGENPLRWCECISQTCSFLIVPSLLPRIFMCKLCHLVTHWIEPERRSLRRFSALVQTYCGGF